MCQLSHKQPWKIHCLWKRQTLQGHLQTFHSISKKTDVFNHWLPPCLTSNNRMLQEYLYFPWSFAMFLHTWARTNEGCTSFTSTLRNCCPCKAVTFTWETGPSIPNLVSFFCGQAPLEKHLQWLLEEACQVCRAVLAAPLATACESSSSPKLLNQTCTVIQVYQKICAGIHQNSFGQTTGFHLMSCHILLAITEWSGHNCQQS